MLSFAFMVVIVLHFGINAVFQILSGLQVAAFVREQLWDESSQRLRRSFCRKPSAVQGFADDYSYLISKHGFCFVKHCQACCCHFDWLYMISYLLHL